MAILAAELILVVAVLVLLAVAAGTSCAQLFLAASRGRPDRHRGADRDT